MARLPNPNRWPLRIIVTETRKFLTVAEADQSLGAVCDVAKRTHLEIYGDELNVCRFRTVDGFDLENDDVLRAVLPNTQDGRKLKAVLSDAQQYNAQVLRNAQVRPVVSDTPLFSVLSPPPPPFFFFFWGGGGAPMHPAGESCTRPCIRGRIGGIHKFLATTTR